jgi:uncharacterized protein (DUF427 family)
VKAYWKNQLLAESNDTVIIDNNHYFPASSLNMDFFEASNKETHCHWKGEAHYYTIIVNNEINKDAAWYYPSPKDAAKEIKDHVAFWRGVKVTE